MTYVTGGNRPGDGLVLRRRLCRRGAALAAVGLIAAVSLFGLLGRAPAAAAKPFYIRTCNADAGNFSTAAFEEFATRGMLLRRACNPEGPGLRGLITSNVQRPGRVKRGSRSIFILRAPPGTYFSTFTWSGDIARSDCRYALHLWAYDPRGPMSAIRHFKANRNCANRENRTQVAGWRKAVTYDVPGATSIVQRIVCVGKRGEPYCSSRSRNFIRTFTASAQVVDVSPPSVSVVQDNPFTRGAWVSGRQSVTYTASDNVGVKVAHADIGGTSGGDHVRFCNYAQRVPCPSGLGAIAVDTSRLLEGSQRLTVSARDAADNSGVAGPVTVRVDNTAPGAVPVAVEGGEGWRHQNNFSLAWTNPSEGDRAPIAAAHYRLCAVGSGRCMDSSQAAPGIARLAGLSLPSPGEWQARIWREDAAKNREPANASVPVTLRYDPDPPQLAFQPSPASDPTLVSVQVTDDVSGMAGGRIELGRQGSGIWQSLPTQQQAGRLVARIDDALLPPGPYVLRATAWDRAANQNSTDRLVDGRPMVVNLPLRVPTAMRAGAVVKRVVKRKIGRPGKRRTARRRVSELRQRVRVAYGDHVRIQGRLEDRGGEPLANADVQVLARTGSEAEQLVAVVRTDEQGRYSFVAPANATRALRFVYRGTALMLPVEQEVQVFVEAASTIRARPRSLRNGRAVRFSGRLRSLPAPSTGKLVELQVVLSGRWQTFRTTRTEAGGRWKVRYRFRRSCGLIRYRFRARLPAESAYSFETGHTRPVMVKVIGRPCP